MARRTNPRNDGLTLIELVMVLVIVGIISAVAIPSYIERSSYDLMKKKIDVSGSVKSAMVLAIADNKLYPTVEELTAYVQGDEVIASLDGVELKIEGLNYTVPTYTDSNCTKITSAIKDKVQCVGSIP